MESLGSGEGLGVLGGWVSVGLGATFCGHGYRVWGVVVWWCCLWGCVVEVGLGLWGVGGCVWGGTGWGCIFLFGVWVSLGRLGWGVICV